MMTAKQNELLEYITKFLAETKTSPSFEQMKNELGLKSKSGVHRLVLALEERGLVVRLPGRARAVVPTSIFPTYGIQKSNVIDKINITIRMHKNNKISAALCIRSIEQHILDEIDK